MKSRKQKTDTKPDLNRAAKCWFERDRLQIKFADRHKVRLRKGQPVDAGGKALASRHARLLLDRLSGVQWLEMHAIGAAKLDQLRALAQPNAKEPLPDLANWYVLLLPHGLDAFDVAAEFSELPEVEHAMPMRKPAPLPTAPNFADLTAWTNQGYLKPAPLGVDAPAAWARPGGNGEFVTIADVEYDWLTVHNEFAGSSIERVPLDNRSRPVDFTSHGTAVVSVFGGSNDGEGVTGISYACRKVASTVMGIIYNAASAITAAVDATAIGDIILIEQQTAGPNSLPQPIPALLDWSETGMVPAEWDRGVYDAVKTAVAAGRIVVEAAGNGSVNLDDPMFSTQISEGLDFWRTSTHAPFTAAGDSGAIMVGADSGEAPDVPTGGGNHVRADFSNFGSRVNVHSWGACVIAAASDTGAPLADLYSGEGRSRFYTQTFGGTSSASAIVAGVCACTQGMFKAKFGRPMSPPEMRALLVRTGTPQVSGGNIGPQPDLKRVSEALEGGAPRPLVLYPPTGSVVQLPASIRVSRDSNGPMSWLTNPSIWYTLSSIPPTPNTAGSIQLCEGDDCLSPPPIVLTTLSSDKITVGLFADSSGIGPQLMGPMTTAEYTPYIPAAGPPLTASRGEFEPYVRLTWQPNPSATAYQLCTGQHGPTEVLMTVAGDISNFDDTTASEFGFDQFYWIRAEFPSGHNSLFTGPVVGRRKVPSLTLSVDSMHEDHVHLEWNAPLWIHVAGQFEYQVFRAASALPAMAEKIATIVPGRRLVSWNGRDFFLPTEPDRFFDDRSMASGQLCFYWVRAIDEGNGLSTPFGPAVAGGAFGRLASRGRIFPR